MGRGRQLSKNTSPGATKSAQSKNKETIKKESIKKIEEPKAEDDLVSEEEEDEDEDDGVQETIYEMSDDSAVESEEEEEEEDEDESEIDEEALLAGIKGSDESDISESEGEQEDSFGKGSDMIDLDTKAGKLLRSRLEKAGKNTEKAGVVFVGRIPHGFYEEEMRGYFSQFGDIKRLRLSRNPSTGKSRHYAFIEFKSSEVATIVADTMNNYIMFDRLLKCKVVPESSVHEKLFANCKKPLFTLDLNKKKHIQIFNRQRTQKNFGEQVDRLVKRETKRRSRLVAAGIDYDFPGYQELRPPKAKHVKFD
ncbi:nucleolar protein [Coemansia sp. BCRC 34490]|nr:nucleolar protein [Coemansia sp. BCRC 34490]